jgi:pantetheine-phosphate adenylyltransferase
MNKAIYPGSFDPITNGHIDIVYRACSLFDEVTIAVFDNPSKSPLFTSKERVDLIQCVFEENRQVKVEYFSGLLAQYAESKSIFTIIRGLRAVSDFDYEFQLSIINRKLNHNLDTIFLMTDQKFSYLSSSVVKQLSSFDATIDSLVPEAVKRALQSKQNISNDSQEISCG